MDLSTTLCGKKMKNPLVLASGILDVTAASMLRVVKEGGAGAVTCKSTNVEGKKGHPNPVLLTDPHWVMNAVGLSNPGIEETRGEIEVYKKKEKTAPILLSIFAKTVKDYAEITREADRTEADLIEVNISCPNVEDEFGRPFALDPKIAAAVTKIVRKNTQKKVLVNLSPQAGSIAEVAKACEQAGADGITAIKTVGPGIAIRLEARKPTRANLR
ncbi:MAG TPA: dihydroorotate dehydrogenase, partial [Candidatus Marinimicrobia bacterium]|nr:dihydroorotate dehydrogenase [Candidatus Neomarinimicrobiota bacterium]